VEARAVVHDDDDNGAKAELADIVLWGLLCLGIVLAFVVIMRIMILWMIADAIPALPPHPLVARYL
jgi:hypothetical protein